MTDEIQPTADRLETIIRATLASTVNPYVIGDIISLVRKGIKAEREACAKVAEDCSIPGEYASSMMAESIAAAIRKRGEQ